MQTVRSYFAFLCVLLMLAPAGSFAADQPSSPRAAGAAATEPVPLTSGEQPGGFFARITNPYRTRELAPPALTNSTRLESLMRAGNIYLSLQDCIALALENNIDIAIQRYTPQIAEANLLHARAGGFATSSSTTVFAGPSSVAAAAPSSGLQSYLIAASTQVGITPSSFDPALIGSAAWAHTTAPQSNTVVTGTSALIQRQDTSSGAYQQYFPTGTQMNLSLSNTTTSTNSARSSFSPGTSAALTLTMTQHLLQSFGPSVNTRQIRIARNNREVSDLTFKAQVITTVSAIKDLYWDLVTYNESVKVQRDALAAQERLLSDNRIQVKVGTLAPISVVQAEAEVASGQQAVTIAETQVLQQETILKSALSRTGVVNPVLANAHIIPTDTIRVPESEAISPLQDSAALAESSRPELSQFRILLQNQQIAIRGTRNELLPTLDVVGTLTNNALAGQVNPLLTSGSAPAVFIGGYGTVLSQLFARNYPTYSLGFNLNIPLRNRAAQADLANSQLTLRQQQLGLQRLQNQVRVEVQNAVIGLQQARAQYQAAAKQRVLEEQTVDAERKKLTMGVSTTYNVILTERDLVTAQSNEVAARSAYAKAKVEMDRATGQTLNNDNISIEEAFEGRVSRPPTPLPSASPTPARP